MITPSTPNDVIINNKFIPPAGQLAAHFTLSGGGTATWNGTYLKWSGRVAVAPVLKPELATDGIYWLDLPGAGTVITYHSSSGTASITITADGIPLSSWQALYWRMPFQATSQGGALLNLFVVDKDSTTWTPTGRNILIAVNNPDHGLKWMPYLLSGVSLRVS